MFVFIFLFAFMFVLPAYAYIGPGLGIAAIWMLLGPLAAILVTVALIAYFPLRYLYKKHKAKKLSSKDETVDDSDSGEDEA